MRYDIIKNVDANEVVKETRAHIRRGWIPSGGVAVAFDQRNRTSAMKGDGCIVFAQAVILEDEEEAEAA